MVIDEIAEEIYSLGVGAGTALATAEKIIALTQQMRHLSRTEEDEGWDWDF